MEIPTTTQHQLIASPGIAIVEPLVSKTTSAIITQTKPKGRIGIGKIISMGKDILTDFGSILKASDYGKEGDVVYFLSYYEEGGYDFTSVDNKQVYMVKWQDFRSILQEEQS